MVCSNKCTISIEHVRREERRLETRGLRVERKERARLFLQFLSKKKNNNKTRDKQGARLDKRGRK